MKQKPDSYFAPAQRTSEDKLMMEHEYVLSQNLLGTILNAISGINAVIDDNRQIVYANHDFLKLLGLNSMDDLLGKRPGEAIACIHAQEEKYGCGTSRSCAYCGAVAAILECQHKRTKISKEARVTSCIDEKMVSWDLHITCSPFQLQDKNYYILTIQDISDEKRRSNLERIFFHDLLNSAGGLHGLLEILKNEIREGEEDVINFLHLSEELSREIIDEIVAHRQIRAAEQGDLKVTLGQYNSLEMLESAVAKIRLHEVGKNKSIYIDPASVNVPIQTDKSILQRILINLLKNALEATNEGELIEAGIEEEDKHVIYWVKNQAVIPVDIQMQLFQRSFSTKGTNRGIGTYSIKLLTEQYLKGKVSFVSNETSKTIFYIELPQTGSKDFLQQLN